MTRVMVVCGLVLLAAGLLLGLLPGSAPGASSESMNCGSPWVRSHADEQRSKSVDALANAMAGGGLAKDYRAECDDALGSRGVFGGVLGGLGLVTLIGVGLVVARRQSGPTSGPSVSA
jgi:hypothetical protein